MAARKPMMGPKPAHPELDEKVRLSLQTPMTDAQYMEQKASYAYGNAPDTAYITKDSARKAVSSYRLKDVA